MRGRHQTKRQVAGGPVALCPAQADNVSYDIVEAAGPDEETEAGLRCCQRGAQ